MSEHDPWGIQVGGYTLQETTTPVIFWRKSRLIIAIALPNSSGATVVRSRVPAERAIRVRVPGLVRDLCG